MTHILMLKRSIYILSLLHVLWILVSLRKCLAPRANHHMHAILYLKCIKDIIKIKDLCIKDIIKIKDLDILRNVFWC